MALVLEDLHWADADTLEMIIAFLRETEADEWPGGCMFIMTTRPSSAFPAYLREKRDRIIATG